MSQASHPEQPDDPRASVAVDLGAESCRVSLLRWINGEPRVELVHRFPNGPIRHADNSARWPLRNIEAGVDEGMRRCAELATEGIRSVAVDGWAVDYVRVDDNGKPLDEPFCYRDERNLAAEQHLHTLISPERLIELTGVQQLSINTLYQLHADRMADLPPGRRWLNLPEYMLARWGAEPVAEFSNATHTQLIDLYSRNWNQEIFDIAGLDLTCAPRIVPSGTLLGKLEGPLTALAAYRDTDLIAPAAHDTASAIAGIPAHGEDWAYISSGTWSLVGALIQQPQNSLGARADNFTNLGAVGGATCFHKNVNGMWLIKQCMDAWAAAVPANSKPWTIEEVLAAAAKLSAPDQLLTVDDRPLLLVGHMPERINAQRAARGLRAMDESPAGAPAMVALILHSLAARYAQILARVQHHTGKQLQRLFIVGGGSRNTLLNQLTAKATGLSIHCGSAESSTIGNLAVQLAVLEGHNPSESRQFSLDVAGWAKRLSS